MIISLILIETPDPAKQIGNTPTDWLRSIETHLHRLEREAYFRQMIADVGEG